MVGLSRDGTTGGHWHKKLIPVWNYVDANSLQRYCLSERLQPLFGKSTVNGNTVNTSEKPWSSCKSLLLCDLILSPQRPSYESVTVGQEPKRYNNPDHVHEHLSPTPSSALPQSPLGCMCRQSRCSPDRPKDKASSPYEGTCSQSTTPDKTSSTYSREMQTAINICSLPDGESLHSYPP